LQERVHKAGTKGVWQSLRAINGSTPAKAANAITTINSKDGALITDKEEGLKRLRQHFAELAAEQHAVTDASKNVTLQVAKLRSGITELTDSETQNPGKYKGVQALNADITPVEVVKLFGAMNWWKSIGHDEIRGSILSVLSASRAFAARTSELFTAILRSSDIPQQWRVVILTVLYKGKGVKQDASNTRGIALLSILAKAYEKILVDRIIIFLERNGQFDQNTNGLRKGRSAVDNAMLVMMAAEAVLLEGGRLLGAFLDERKCYPTAFRDGIMLALHQAGVTGDVWHAMDAMQKGAARGVEQALGVRLSLPSVLKPVS
jgi:hypothetical protein